MSHSADERLRALEQLRAELQSGGRSAELEALDQVIAAARATASTGINPGTSAAEFAAPNASGTGGARLDVPKPVGSGAGAGRGQAKTYLKLKKKYYTPAEVARRVGVSRQTIVKWIERGELEAELTPGGHHRIPASVFHREGRGEAVQLIPVEDE